MIFVQPLGRMGNQMFQIATAYAVAHDNGDEFVCSENVLALSPHTMEHRQKLRKTIFRKIVFDSTKFNPSFKHTDEHYFSYKPIEYKSGLCLSGYYQSVRYFEHLEQEMRTLFEAPKEISQFLEENYADLLDDPNTCAVHVRRGDYLKYKNFHHNLTPSYYTKALESMGSNKRFVFFSDDISWCRENFSHLSKDFVDTGDDVCDFYLMSRMKNNIIANSSYGWWAAYLNENEGKKIICPSNWFGPGNSHLSIQDLFPKNWKIIKD